MTINSYQDDDDDDDVSSMSSFDSLEYETNPEVRIRLQKRKAKRASKGEIDMNECRRKIEEWEQSRCALPGLLDTTDASILEVDGHKLKLIKPGLFTRLTDLLWRCRMKKCLSYFTHPGHDDCDGGMGALENSPGLISRKDVQHYATKSRIAIQQYNDSINDQPLLKLEFCSFIRLAFLFGLELYITFTASQNGQLGTYQAVVDDDWLGHEDGDGDVNLVLLRHVEADKIIAIMSLSGAEEEWEKRFGKDWKLRGSGVGQDA